ncbi:hypothetical protein [Erwinia sp. MYb416]|uniref:hypothetical protein n=1 Tax=Erwinia sp. MYb416 TaxID=3108532 RepID=UPI0030B3C31E
MRIQRSNQPKKLYRKVNTTTWGQVQNHPGGEYRWLRHKKNIADDNLPMREGMHGRLERGRDYTLAAFKEFSYFRRYTSIDGLGIRYVN